MNELEQYISIVAGTDFNKLIISKSGEQIGGIPEARH